MFLKLRGKENHTFLGWPKVERMEEEPVPVKGQVWERKFSGSEEDALVLDVMNIQLEVQQAVQQVRPRDKNLDIFCLEVIIVIMKMDCFLGGKICG